MATEEETKRIREQARAIIERARSDSDYLDQLRDRPEETIRTASVPEWAVAKAAKQITPPEAQGYWQDTDDAWWPSEGKA